MGRKNVYFGWGKGRKKALVKVKDGDKLTDELIEMPRKDNRDHNGIVCMTYQVVEDRLKDDAWEIQYAVSFCAPGDPFSRQTANENFADHIEDQLVDKIVVKDVPVNFTAEFIRDRLLKEVLVDAVKWKKPVIAGINTPGWLKRSIKRAELGLER